MLLRRFREGFQGGFLEGFLDSVTRRASFHTGTVLRGARFPLFVFFWGEGDGEQPARRAAAAEMPGAWRLPGEHPPF